MASEPEPPEPKPEIDESDLTAVWRAAQQAWEGGKVVAGLLVQLRVVELTPTHATLAPIPGASAGTAQLAERRLGECSVILTRVLGRPIRAQMAEPDEQPTVETDVASPTIAGPPPVTADDIPDDHPLVNEVRQAFGAEIVDKVAKQRPSSS